MNLMLIRSTATDATNDSQKEDPEIHFQKTAKKENKEHYPPHMSL